jgi:hypothetical protein
MPPCVRLSGRLSPVARPLRLRGGGLGTPEMPPLIIAFMPRCDKQFLNPEVCVDFHEAVF